jgi:DNA-directed RNA polymerase specialized sigma24 family protein
VENIEDHTNGAKLASDSDSFWNTAVAPVRKKLVGWFNKKYPGHGEDLAQVALLKAWRSFDGVRWQHLPIPDQLRLCRGFLWNAAVMVAADHYKSSRKVAADGAGQDEINPLIRQLKESVSREDFLTILNSLPETTRQILSLRLADGMAWSEIAEEVGLQKKDAAAVGMRFHRAVRKFGS